MVALSNRRYLISQFVRFPFVERIDRDMLGTYCGCSPATPLSSQLLPLFACAAVRPL
jgi:hypothetical protein